MFRNLRGYFHTMCGTCIASICKINVVMRNDFHKGKIDLMLYQVVPFLKLELWKTK